MDIGKEQIFEERRQQRANDVTFIFTDEFGFIVLKEPAINGKIELSNIKYFGTVKPETCTCQSFYHGNSENYQITHAEIYNCKHLIKAKEKLDCK